MKTLDTITVFSKNDLSLSYDEILLQENKKTTQISIAKILTIKQKIDKFNEISVNQNELLEVGIKKDVLQFAKYSLLKDITDIIEQLYPFDIINKVMQIPENFDLISIELSINKGLSKDAEIYKNTDMYYKTNSLDIVENNTKFVRKEVSIFYPIMPCDKYPLACGIIQLYYLKLTYSFNCNY